MKQNPFGLYDFLGYLIPGALFMYILYFFFNMDFAYNLLDFEKENRSSINNEILTFIPAVILAYIIGHTFSLLSSFFIENYATYLYGYPSKYLFIENHKFWSKESGCKKTWKNLGRIILFIILLPISFTIFALKLLNITLFEQAKPLPKELGETVFNQCMTILNTNLKISTKEIAEDKEEKGISRDYFRIIYHFIFENSEKHSVKLQNYVALYGFCRTISFIFLINFWISSYLFIFDNENYIYLILLFLILSFSFFTGFIKFYRRYTLEALMGATIFNKYSITDTVAPNN